MNLFVRTKLLLISLLVTLVVITIKLVLHYYFQFEPIEQSSLHNALVSSAIFVISFLLSANIADFKESERLPAQFASTIDDMYHDAKQLHVSYPDFDLEAFRLGLLNVLSQFRLGTRQERHQARQEITDLQGSYGQMERAGVPPNFVTKLKTQSSQLSNNLYRINYIQRIQFLPSATLLVWLIVGIVVTTLVLTNMSTTSGELVITGSIAFMMVYILLLIRVISVPFHPSGTTMDDVSLFLIREVRDYLESQKPASKSR